MGKTKTTKATTKATKADAPKTTKAKARKATKDARTATREAETEIREGTASQNGNEAGRPSRGLLGADGKRVGPALRRVLAAVLLGATTKVGRKAGATGLSVSEAYEAFLPVARLWDPTYSEAAAAGLVSTFFRDASYRAGGRWAAKGALWGIVFGPDRDGAPTLRYSASALPGLPAPTREEANASDAVAVAAKAAKTKAATASGPAFPSGGFASHLPTA